MFLKGIVLITLMDPDVRVWHQKKELYTCYERRAELTL